MTDLPPTRETHDGDPWPTGEQPDPDGPPERPFFPHPPWTVGLVLVFGVVFLILGVLGHPLWLLGGSPFVLVLLIWIAVRIVERRRARR